MPSTRIKALPTRDADFQKWERALEHVLQVPFDRLLQMNIDRGEGTPQELLMLGKEIYEALLKVASGEAGSVRIERPKRWTPLRKKPPQNH